MLSIVRHRGMATTKTLLFSYICYCEEWEKSLRNRSVSKCRKITSKCPFCQLITLCLTSDLMICKSVYGGCPYLHLTQMKQRSHLLNMMKPLLKYSPKRPAIEQIPSHPYSQTFSCLTILPFFEYHSSFNIIPYPNILLVCNIVQ